MNVYCAWCGKFIREVPDCTIPGDSHGGMCPEHNPAIYPLGKLTVIKEVLIDKDEADANKERPASLQ
jgi:hypothetical protein